MATLVPAYGRQCKTIKDCLDAINQRKDFVFHQIGHRDDGRYICLSELESGHTYTVRYANNTKVTSVRVKLSDGKKTAVRAY